MSDAVSRRNPTWERDELILALELYFTVPYSKVNERTPEVVALSKLLNELPLHAERTPTFRNANGVAMKLGNFARLDPVYTRGGTATGLSAGGERDREVWLEFAADLPRLKAVAAHIRSAYQLPEAAAPMVPDEDEEEFAEGRVLYRLHRARERNRQLIAKAKRDARTRHGALKCVVCQFDFEYVYGELGDGYIEAHHTVALSVLDAETKTKPSDLALVCANCHRMLHRRRPWLAVKDLKSLLHGGHIETEPVDE